MLLLVSGLSFRKQFKKRIINIIISRSQFLFKPVPGSFLNPDVFPSSDCSGNLSYRIRRQAVAKGNDQWRLVNRQTFAHIQAPPPKSYEIILYLNILHLI